jgi:KDO2-lipid IV(A) lauroyltransferase
VFAKTEKIPHLVENKQNQSCIVAIGHFGNFELYARFGEFMPGFQCATTYRALRPPSLNRLLQSLRERSGCLFFERRTDAEALKAALAARPLMLGLLADQHAGQRGVAAPFFGHTCSTSAAPAILALRYQCRLFTGFCYRIGLGRWRIEAGQEIPTHEATRPRSIEAITTDINRAFEDAVRRDPANWFWVHNRWKPFRSRHASATGPTAVS